jgi:hypothetical protein
MDTSAKLAFYIFQKQISSDNKNNDAAQYDPMKMKKKQSFTKESAVDFGIEL